MTCEAIPEKCPISNSKNWPFLLIIRFVKLSFPAVVSFWNCKESRLETMNSLEDPWELGKRVIIDLFRLSDNGDICEPLRIERRWWDTVAAIRNEVSQSTGIPHELIDIIYEGRKLPLNYSLYQLAVNKNYIKLYFYCRSTIVGSESWIQVVSTVPVLSVSLCISVITTELPRSSIRCAECFFSRYHTRTGVVRNGRNLLSQRSLQMEASCI